MFLTNEELETSKEEIQSERTEELHTVQCAGSQIKSMSWTGLIAIFATCSRKHPGRQQEHMSRSDAHEPLRGPTRPEVGSIYNLTSPTEPKGSAALTDIVSRVDYDAVSREGVDVLGTQSCRNWNSMTSRTSCPARCLRNERNYLLRASKAL